MTKDEKIRFLQDRAHDSMCEAIFHLEVEREWLADDYALDAMKFHKIACDLEKKRKA